MSATYSLIKCEKCGNYLQMISAGNRCPICDVQTWHGTFLYEDMNDALKLPTPTINEGTFGRHGWICPKCGRGCSPYVDYSSCGRFDKWDVTCNSKLATTPGEVNKDENSNYGSATTGSSNCTTLCK